MSSWACRYGVLAFVCALAGAVLGGCSIITSGGTEPSYPAPPPYRSPAEAEAAQPAAPAPPQPIAPAAAENNEPAPPWLSELPEPAAVLAVFPSPAGDYATIARSEAAFAVLADYIEIRGGADQSLLGDALLATLPPAARARWQQYVGNGYSKLLSGTNGSWQMFVSPQFRAQVLLQFLPPASVAEYEATRNAVAGIPGPSDASFVAQLAALAQPQAAAAAPSAEELMRLGAQYRSAKDYEHAIAAFQQVVSLAPNDGHAYVALALSYDDAQQWQLAADAWKDAESRMQFAAAHYVVMGRDYMQAKQYAEATAAFRRAIALAPQSDEAAVAYSRLATMELDGGESEAALADLKETVRLDPKMPNAQLMLALCYVDLQDGDQAITAAQEAVRQAPDDPRAVHVLGIAFLAADQLTEAMDTYRVLKTMDKAAAADLLQGIHAH